MSEDNYKKAKDFLLPLSSSSKAEGVYSKHLGMNFGSWYLELHGSLRSGLSTRLDKEIDAAQRDIFYGGKVRSWLNGRTHVFLPGIDEDVFFIFTHYVRHFYKEDVGLKQICDWIRLLWTYRDMLNHRLLESRLRKSGLMTEWKVFAAIAVCLLGMPIEAMPFFDENDCNNKFKRKMVSLLDNITEGRVGSKIKDTLRIAKVFPFNTIRFLPGILFNVNTLKLQEMIRKK